MQLDGKVCVVTGSGSGIGRATALEMAKRGGKVVVSDVNDANGNATVDEIAKAGGSAVYRHADMRSKEDIAALMQTAVDTYGALHVLHNNAGVHESDFTNEMTVQSLSEEVWDTLMDINLKAVWLCTKAAFPFMRDAGGGAVINAGSTASVAAFPNCPAYAVAKHGIVGLTKAMAMDFRNEGIRANCYCPASIETNMVSKFIDAAEDPDLIRSFMAASHLFPKRLGHADEVAKLVCFLASDDASFVNGAAILVDAGCMAWRGSE